MAFRAFNTALPWLLVGAGGYALYQLLLQNGRLLTRVEAVEQRLTAVATLERRLEQCESGVAPSAPQPAGTLQQGTRVPDFELRDLDGNLRRLSEWEGSRVLLVFFNPESPFCQQLLPVLAALPRRDERLPVVVTSGPHELNRDLFARYAFPYTVLVQEGAEVVQLLAVPGTPVAYLLDERAMVIAPPALGLAQVLELAGAHQDAPDEAASQPTEPSSVQALNAALTVPLSREGLLVGTAAPPIMLPLLDGGEASLESYRGRRVVLVFSDPDCAPCEALAAPLQSIHAAGHGPAVLMVSRGTLEANRAMREQLGISFPVALQRHWEVSRAYGKVATPVAYSIDEAGRIASPLATGTAAILALLSREVRSGVLDGTA